MTDQSQQDTNPKAPPNEAERRGAMEPVPLEGTDPGRTDSGRQPIQPGAPVNPSNPVEDTRPAPEPRPEPRPDVAGRTAPDQPMQPDPHRPAEPLQRPSSD